MPSLLGWHLFVADATFLPEQIDKQEGKNQLVIAIGCTGGKHRSVTLANEIYKLIWESLFIDMEAFVYYYSTFSRSYTNALSKDKEELTDEEKSLLEEKIIMMRVYNTFFLLLVFML